jgi:NAD(P)-dependent dehydrogenase (short-subunit alcohol dehydrogenase family)
LHRLRNEDFEFPDMLVADCILVNAIAPGRFASDMNRAARDLADAVAARTPLRRIGRDEDMAGAAIRPDNFLI